ncbi:GNAT family N-acetyltransferase [Paludibacterium paludis]|nr:GNAT family N-acetyltransferase [Paludibacterium paludis]
MQTSSLARSVTLRPARQSDEPFIAQVYRAARPDLLLIDAEPDFVRMVQDQQWNAMRQGAGEHSPDAMHFIVEKTGAGIGAVMVDFGHNEVRLLFLGLLPEARGKGYARDVLAGLQQAARQVCTPLAVVAWHDNLPAKRLYRAMGFVPEESGPVADKLVWYPAPPEGLPGIS